MNGVRHIEDTENCHLIVVDDFTDDLRNAIRSLLCEICYGQQTLSPGSMRADYQVTIRDFLDRYDSKTIFQKKGIIAELLTHILARHYLDFLEPASILFNKEERSMRKGFDLVLIEPECETVWYSEVKSGHPALEDTSSEKCLDLLRIARTDITDRLTNTSSTAWFSAVVDSSITVSEQIRPTLQRLLDVDAIAKQSDDFSAAAILVAVVYAPSIDLVDYDCVSEYFEDTRNDTLFSDLIVLSVQKETVDRIVEFLRSEI